jgi:capsular polysaccharide transport system ATP-binding protein
MIAFDRVTKTFALKGARKVVLDDVSIEFPRGRSIGLLGRNGAGKSTLLRMIAGASEPDRGVIRRNVRMSWPLGFGGGFHAFLTGAQNARFVARIYGIDTEDMVRKVLKFSELGSFFYEPVETFSSGMKARLAFGMSMAVDFDVYLVDEITSVGDAAFRKKCAEAFDEKRAKADVIMVSHNPNVIRRYCDSGAVLENGRLTYYHDVREAIAVHDENMSRAYRAI